MDAIKKLAHVIEEVALWDGQEILGDDEAVEAFAAAHKAATASAEIRSDATVQREFEKLFGRMREDTFAHLGRATRATLRRLDRGHDSVAHYQRTKRTKYGAGPIVRGEDGREYGPLASSWNALARQDTPLGRRARGQLQTLAKSAAQLEERYWQESGAVSSTLPLDARVELLSFDRHGLDSVQSRALLDAAKQAIAQKDAAFASRILRELSAGLGVGLPKSREQWVAIAKAEIELMQVSSLEDLYLQRIDVIQSDSEKLVSTHIGLERLEREIGNDDIHLPKALAAVQSALADAVSARRQRFSRELDALTSRAARDGLIGWTAKDLRDLIKTASQAEEFSQEIDDERFATTTTNAWRTINAAVQSVRTVAEADPPAAAPQRPAWNGTTPLSVHEVVVLADHLLDKAEKARKRHRA